MGRDRGSRQHGSSHRASAAGGETGRSPGKQTLVEQAYASAAPAQPSAVRSDLGGLRPGAPQDQDVGGSTPGEASRDSGAAASTGADAGGAPAVSVSSTTTSAAVWSPHGFFHWEVAFSTTGRSGWLVQEIHNARHVQNASGAVLPDGLTPRYWEAWSVDAAGAITPMSGATHDFWQRRSWGTGTKGNWSMTGAVHFTSTNPGTMGFTVGGAPEAGSLLSTTSAPGGLGAARLNRHANGTWDSTGATTTHAGSAGP